MENNRHERAARAYAELERLARGTTQLWKFGDWYANGVDWFLAREVVYLMVELFAMDDARPQDGICDFSLYSPDQLAGAAYEYASSMDDFTRLWNSDENKLEVLKEVSVLLRDTWPEVEYAEG